MCMKQCVAQSDRRDAQLRRSALPGSAPAPAPTPRPRSRGINTTELVVTIGILTFLVAVSMPMLSAARRGGAQAQCAANLHHLVIALNNYTTDNFNTFPAPTLNAQWEDLLRSYVPRKIFRCPADAELYSSLGSSYDWRDTANPDCTLAGRSFHEVTRGEVSLAFDALPGWHFPAKLQVLYFDGAVRIADDQSFLLELQTSVTAGHP
jgi:hypothetical protein